MNLKDINAVINQMKGKQMTETEKALHDVLCLRVKNKEISVEQAHQIWDQMLSVKALKKALKEGKQ
jgi:hypothetical protein